MTTEFMAYLFINLFIILIAIQLIYFWHVKYGVIGEINPFVTGVCQALAIGANVIFFSVGPYSVNEPLNYSSLSIIIGTYYGGSAVGVCLFILTLIISFFQTTSYILFHLLSGLVTLFSVLITRKKFHQLSFYRRLGFSWSIALFSSLLIMLIFTFLNHNNLSATDIFTFILLYSFGMLWLTYSIERLERNRNFRNKLIDTEKMQSVSHLAASISHEVRNPLTATKGFLQLLRNDENLSREKKQQFIDIAISELDRAETIIKDFLAFAKPHIDSKEDINIQLELNKVVDIVRPLAHMRNVTIQVDVPSFIVKGERTLFQQCFVNILKNGIESMENKGVLILTTIEKKKGVEIVVSDTGIGMTGEQLKRLGEPYYSTKGVEGTGLGMMAVYRIIESMKGSLRVKSKPGEGTTFTIYFPGHE